MVEVMFSLGFFYLEGSPLTFMRVLYLRLCMVCVFSERETDRETVRENRGYYSRSAVGFVSSFLLDNRKEGLAVWGGCSPNRVNHVYLCLSGFYVFCVLVISAYYMCCISM